MPGGTGAPGGGGDGDPGRASAAAAAPHKGRCGRCSPRSRALRAPRAPARAAPRAPRAPRSSARTRASSLPGPPPGSVFVVRWGVPGPRLPGPSRSTARLGPAGSGTPSNPRRCPGWRSLRTPFYAFAGSPGVGDTSPRGAVPRRRSEWASDPFECRGQLASETKASQYCHLACQGRATGLPGSPARAVEEGLREGAQKCARPPSL